MNLQLVSRWFYCGFSIAFFLHRVDPLRRIARPFLFCRLYSSDRPADRFNCTWSLLLFVGPVLLIFLCDRLARSTGVCFRVPPSLFYSFERRICIFTTAFHLVFPRRDCRLSFKNDHVDHIISIYNVHKLKKNSRQSRVIEKHKSYYFD